MEASVSDPVSLQEVFALLPEVRQARGRRHPLLTILNLTASKAAATRYFAVRPQEAFPLVTGEYPEN